jgi:5-methylcytosine-specific restriction enzyme A
VTRKWGPCAAVGCPVLTSSTYCGDHQPEPWKGSTRRGRLPANWRALSLSILKRDLYTCHVCDGFGSRVDHIVAGDNHHPSNLAAICLDCDRRKSAHEGGSAQGRYTL